MKTTKKIIASLFLVLSFMALSAPHIAFAESANSETAIMASQKTMKYHRPTCGWAKKIKPENLVEFKSKDEAIDAGYKRCKICKP